jgi:ABC-type transport system substrate-binding protein
MGVEAPRSFDPARATRPLELLVADLLFDSLTTYDPATLAVRPAIARRWETSPDQRQWNFFLRPDARFGNGRAITPADVKYSLERVASASSQLPLADQLERVKGFADFHSGKAGALAGVTVLAPNLVHVELDSPLSTLPAVLGNPALAIVPREAVEKPAPVFGDQPVGSGPFRFGRRAGGVVHLVRAPGSRALLDGIDLHLLTEDKAYAAFGRGELDWSLVPAAKVGAAAARYGRAGFRPLPGVSFYGLNRANPKLADGRVRQAIVRAVDRQAIVKTVYGGSVLPAAGLVVRGIPGAQADPCGAACTFDRKRAKALLADAFPGGSPPELQLDFDPSTRQEATARAVQAGLAAVGITAHLRPHADEGEYSRFLASGRQEMFRLGWVGLYPSPDAFLTPLFSSGSASNLTHLSSPEVDRLLAQARAEAGETKRLALYHQAERKILEQFVVVPVAQFELHTVTAARVRALRLSAMGTFDGSRVWLAARGGS